eukprot:3318927-Rhodomonas_salina.1
MTGWCRSSGRPRQPDPRPVCSLSSNSARMRAFVQTVLHLQPAQTDPPWIAKLKGETQQKVTGAASAVLAAHHRRIQAWL